MRLIASMTNNKKEIIDNVLESDEQVRLDLIASFFSGLSPFSEVALAITGVLVAVMVNEFIPLWALISWLSAVVLSAGLTGYVDYRVAKKIPERHELKTWARGYVWLMILAACVWGSAALLIFPEQSIPHQIAVSVVVIVVVSTIASLMAACLLYFYIWLVLAVSPFAVMFLIQGTSFQTILAALVVVYMLIIAYIAHVGYDRLRELMQLRRKLDYQKHLAEEANIAKSKFLASASHDLRQPLHALSIFTGSLENHIKDRAGEEIITNIHASVGALQNLFNTLLDISKLDSGVLQTNVADISLTNILQQLENEYGPQATGKGLQWRIDCNNMTVKTDPVLLENILRNLVTNAIRYTDTGHVTISCKEMDKLVKVTVADSGPGIPLDEHQAIYREFYQLGNPGRDRRKGLGLGLSIVKRLTDLLQLKLELNSTPGIGSAFSITIPIGDPARVKVIEEISPEAVVDDLPSLTILVIDDEPDILRAMQILLDSWKQKPLLAETVEQAIEQASVSMPDLIISDFRLQDNHTGLEVIRRLQADSALEIPVLIVSGDMSQESLQAIKQSGYPWLQKPVDTGKLRTFIRRVQRKKNK